MEHTTRLMFCGALPIDDTVEPTTPPMHVESWGCRGAGTLCGDFDVQGSGAPLVGWSPMICWTLARLNSSFLPLLSAVILVLEQLVYTASEKQLLVQYAANRQALLIKDTRPFLADVAHMPDVRGGDSAAWTK